MTERFKIFFTRLMKYEGGGKLVNDASDPGGLTKYGISARSHPGVDIAGLTEQGAKELYHSEYYKPLLIDEIEDERAAWQLFDFAVNAGKYRAVKTIQKIIGTATDGEMGPITLKFIKGYKSEYPLYIVYRAERMKHYFALCDKNNSLLKFLKGWLIRTAEL